ncbi:MAG TPA: hypothetical protein VE398_07965 [Acidobacteriota bacterium]|nr:hypothetical protein [Acidobacteriota bacterium]
MDTTYRRLFNEAYGEGLYEAYKSDLCGRLNTNFEFRLAETPVFLPAELRRRLIQSGREILAQLCEPARFLRMRRAIPKEWDTPGMDSLPSFAQLDFAIVRNGDGLLVPRLIELQGFPSLTALQVVQRDAWNAALQGIPGLDTEWSCWFSGMDREGFLGLARRTILGSCDPENVILMDLDPRSQKTYPDFVATKLLFGVDAVCPSTLIRDGRRLLRRGADGDKRLLQVRRIYYRVVFDELLRKQVPLPFDFREELDVQWAPHPNWFWAWSKYSVPFLNHPTVPEAVLLSEISEIPADLSDRYVLKPLFSFAGGGVNVDPRPADIAKIPSSERRGWCLQEKIEYAPAIPAADGGGVKVEVRLMFLRPDDEDTPVLAQNLCRMSRGKMLGVDFNKKFTWVGSSVGLWPLATG